MSYPRYPAYKDSDVEWLGMIPDCWQAKRLKYVAPVVNVKIDQKPVDKKYVGLENVQSGTGQLLLEAQADNVESVVSAFNTGDVLFGKLRPYLAKVVLAPFDGVCTTELLVLRSRQELDHKFLFYALLSDGFIKLIDSSTYGSKMPRANAEQIENTLLSLPSLPEQHAIAAFLDRETARIDALIAKQETLIALLREKRKALISHAVTKGLDRNAPMKDSGVEWLGEVPAHWEVKRLKYLSTKMTAGPFGSALTKDMYTTDGYRVYGQEQVIPGDFTIGDYYISQEKYVEMQQYAVTPGDVLVSCVGTFGKIAVVPDSIQPGIINPRLIRILPNREYIEPSYMGEVLRSQFTFEQLAQHSRGGTMDIINLGLLSEIIIPLPPLHEQHTILRQIKYEHKQVSILIAKAEQFIALLREHRTALIAAAVTGKIDVRGMVDGLEMGDEA